jgi:hypothetical protein
MSCVWVVLADRVIVCGSEMPRNPAMFHAVCEADDQLWKSPVGTARAALRLSDGFPNGAPRLKRDGNVCIAGDSAWI